MHADQVRRVDRVPAAKLLHDVVENLTAGLRTTDRPVATLLDKIRSLVPHKALDYFTGLDETVYVRRMGLTDYAPHAETIATLADAARADRTVELTYRAIWRGEAYTTRLDPYGLVFYDGDLFVVGRSHRAAAVRTFKITRITAAAPTAETFKRPAGFDLEDHFRNSFGIFKLGDEPVEITVKFTGAVTALVEERVWHESQQLTWQPADETLFDQAAGEPGTLIATYRLSGVAEFKRWIKGFGEQAEIVKPPWLRQELREELLAAAERHA